MIQHTCKALAIYMIISFFHDDCRADVNAIDNFTWTPLHHCAHSGQVYTYTSHAHNQYVCKHTYTSTVNIHTLVHTCVYRYNRFCVGLLGFSVLADKTTHHSRTQPLSHVAIINTPLYSLLLIHVSRSIH